MTADTASTPAIRKRLAFHLRATGGSTYEHELLDEAGSIIGRLSSWIGTGKNHGQSRQAYTLIDDPREFSTFPQFLDAYLSRLEATRRDNEWAAAAPKEDLQ